MHRSERFPMGLSRRDWLRLATCGAIGTSVSGWFGGLAHAAAGDRNRKRSCILLWMAGGPSQIDTLDPKPGHENGGPFRAIETTVPGMCISEHLPKLARQGENLAIIRSMHTAEGDHQRATQILRTGYLPQGAVEYPHLGASVAKELGQVDAELPNFVSVAPYRPGGRAGHGAGFLGPRFAPFVVGEHRAEDGQGVIEVPGLASVVAPRRLDARLSLLAGLQRDFAKNRHDPVTAGDVVAYEQAVNLMRSPAARAFDLDQEPAMLRDAYGRNLFGQGCLLARRLVERGVPFVEVTLGGNGVTSPNWDTHQHNFASVRDLSAVLDAGWATLVDDLRTRGLLDTTLVVWMGEFGRTPRINPSAGRDHYPAAWSVAFAGAGIRGGQVLGRTSADGMEVVERPVTCPDLLATVCLALGIDPQRQNHAGERPIRIVDKGARPVTEVLA